MAPEAIVGAFVAIAGALIFAHAAGFPGLTGGYPGPGLFPQVIGALLVISGAAVVVSTLARGRPGGRPPRSSLLRREVANALLVPLAVTAYILLVDQVGFVIIASAIMFVLMVGSGASWRFGLPTSVGVAIATYLLFNRLLKVPLPGGPLGG